MSESNGGLLPELVSLLSTLLGETVLGPANTSLTVNGVTFDLKHSSATSSESFVLTPASGQSAGIGSLVTKALGADLPGVLKTTLDGPLNAVDLTQIYVNFSTVLSPPNAVLGFGCELAEAFTLLDEITLDAACGTQISFVVTAGPAPKPRDLCVAITGSASLFGTKMDVVAQSVNATTWQISAYSADGMTLPSFEVLGGKLNQPLESTLNAAFEALGNASPSYLGLSAIVGVDPFKLLDISIAAQIKIDDVTLAANISVIALMAEGQLDGEAKLPLGLFVGDPDALEMALQDAMFSIALKEKSLSLGGNVGLATDNQTLSLVAKALGIEGDTIGFFLDINGAAKSVHFSAQADSKTGAPAVIPIGELAARLMSDSSALKGSPLVDLGVTIPTISIDAQEGAPGSNGDGSAFDISTTAQLVETDTHDVLGDFFLDVGHSGDKGFDIAIAVAYVGGADLSHALGALHVPDFVVLDDAYLAFGTTAQKLTLPAHEMGEEPVQISIPFADGFALGARGGLTPGSVPAKFVKAVIGADPTVFIAGEIGFISPIELNVSGGVKQLVKFPTKAMKDAWPTVFDHVPKLTLTDLSFRLFIPDDDVEFSLQGGVAIEVAGKTITLTGDLIIQVDEVDVSASISTGSSPLKIDFYDGFDLSFSQFALEIGLGFEGVDPTFGLLAQMGAGGVEAFIAFLIDTGDPQNMMFAGAVSNIGTMALPNVLRSFLPDAGVMTFLDGFELTGWQIKEDIPAAPGDLDGLNKAYKPIVPPAVLSVLKAEQKGVLISAGAQTSAASAWALTDTKTGNIYDLTYSAARNAFSVDRALGLYVVPTGSVQLANQTYNQGFQLNARLVIFEFSAELLVALTTDSFTAEASCTAVSFGPEKALTFDAPSSNATATGPYLTIDTTSLTFKIAAQIGFLGVHGEGEIDIDSGGLTIAENAAFDIGVAGCESFTLTSKEWTSFTLTGQIDLSPTAEIGKIDVGGVTILSAGSREFDVKGSLTVTFGPDAQPKVALSASLELMGYDLPGIDTTLTISNLTQIEEVIGAWIEHNAEDVFKKIEGSAAEYIKFVVAAGGEIDRLVPDLSANLGNVLTKGYHQLINQTTHFLSQVFGDDPDARTEITRNLRTAGYTDPQIEKALKTISGPPGPAGPSGPPGARGVAGPAGPVGPSGPMGPEGVRGPARHGVGPLGPAGPTGPHGHTGPRGAILTGPRGVSGPLGHSGPVGPVGPVGHIGYRGGTGPVGPTGPDALVPFGAMAPVPAPVDTGAWLADVLALAAKDKILEAKLASIFETALTKALRANGQPAHDMSEALVDAVLNPNHEP